MERKLLLLGLLRSQEMHGYQINELIDEHLGTSIELKKPTIYKMLDGMMNDGWIIFHEEREGNYPTRRVYQITPEGEETFQQLLRQSLADYKPISYLGNVGIMYLDTLPAEEAVALLQKRREKVANLAHAIRTDEQHQGGFQLMLSFHIGQLNAEMQLLNELIDHLQQS